MTWQAISWSEPRFAEYIQTAVSSSGSHPAFHMTCLQVKHCKCPEVQTDPFTSRLGNIPTLSCSFLTTNRAGPGSLIWKANRNGDEWSMSGATMAGKSCGSNCKPGALAQKSGREKKEEKKGRRRNIVVADGVTPTLYFLFNHLFYLLCFLPSSFTVSPMSPPPHHKYIISYTNRWDMHHPTEMGSLLNTNFCRGLRVWLLLHGIIAINLNIQFLL